MHATWPIHLLGCCAALGSALAWAAGSVLFRGIGDDLSPAAMNFGKGILSLVYLGAALALVGLAPMDRATCITLGCSAILGIAVGDTLFFAALVRLGPRLTVLGGTLGPVLTVALAAIFLHERLTLGAQSGIALTLTGVTLVSTLSGARAEPTPHGDRRAGLILITLAALCMAGATILAKVGVAHTDALQATFVRMLWSVVALGTWGSATRSMPGWLEPYRKPAVLRGMLIAGLVVVFGGFFLSLLALKYVDASVATALGATEPLLVLPMTLRHGIRPVDIVGALCGSAGVILIVAG